MGERRSQVEPLKGKWSVVGGVRSVAAVGRKTCKTFLVHLTFTIKNKTNRSYLPVDCVWSGKMNNHSQSFSLFEISTWNV